MWLNSGALPLDVKMRDWPIMARSINDEGVIVNVSAMWAHRLDYTPKDMIGRRSVEFLTPHSRRLAAERYLPELFRTGRMSYLRYDFVRSDGVSLVPVLMSAVADSQDGKIHRSLAFIFDNGVTARARRLGEIIAMVSGKDVHASERLDFAAIDAALEALEALIKK